MSQESVLVSILVRYEELRGSGAMPSVEELCRDHPHLLDEVRQHIRGLADLRSLIGTRPDEGTVDSPGVDSPNHVDVSSAVGEQSFHVVRHHAAGGLGDVYLARDVRLGREVALKRMKPSAARNSASRRRFGR